MSPHRSRASRWLRSVVLSCIAVTLAGCAAADPAGEPIDEGADQDEQPFSSNQATLLRFEFDGEFVTTSAWDLERTTQNQLLYTIGQLNGAKAVGRLDNVVLSGFQTTPLGGGLTRVRYHAVLPVGWGKKTNLPTSFELVLPKRNDWSGLEDFTAKYKSACVDSSAHDVTSGGMWYYYRPKRSGCALAADDVVKTTATVTVSTENTSGKYPEYHMVWADQELRVVTIFGKYEDGATTSADAGVAAYGKFVTRVRTELGATLTTVPATLPSQPGVATPDIELSGVLPGGRAITVNALLVDNVASAGATFEARYNELSTDADVIFYNGHAGLGQNVRALAKKGDFAPGKYQIFFMNGCDTFAYVDGYLAQTRAALNPDDPTGTKYMDMITNVMPSYFSSNPSASLAVIKGLLSVSTPKTYEEIFKAIDNSQIVVVTGEEDNVYTPGFDPGGDAWAGMNEKGSVERGESDRFSTGELGAGTYVFTTTDDPSQPKGDVDLYVAVGREPSLSDWDYRPYKDGSAETVTVTLTAPAVVHLMVHGYESAPVQTNYFVLTGKQN